MLPKTCGDTLSYRN